MKKEKEKESQYVYLRMRKFLNGLRRNMEKYFKKDYHQDYLLLEQWIIGFHLKPICLHHSKESFDFPSLSYKSLKSSWINFYKTERLIHQRVHMVPQFYLLKTKMV